MERLDALWQAVPAAWREAAWAYQGDSQVNEAAALDLLLPSLGWQRRGEPLPLSRLTVRHGTQLQLAPLQQERQQRFAACRGQTNRRCCGASC